MLVARLQWVDLVELGARHSWPTESTQHPASPHPKQCLLVWQSDNLLTPPAIVIATGELDEFYAWISTYAAHLVPLSGAYQVTEWCRFEQQSKCKLKTTGAVEMFSALGVVHAEATAACAGEPPSWAGLTPFLSTCSWPIFQCVFSPGPDTVHEVAKRWAEARQLLRATHVDYDLRGVAEVWGIIESALQSGSTSAPDQRHAEGVQFIRSFVEEPMAADRFLEGHSLLRDVFPALRNGSIDRRIDSFKTLIPELLISGRDEVLPPILAGCALSSISRGTFKHVRIVLADRVPDVRLLLWYAWFEFLRDESNPASPRASSITQRLLYRSEFCDLPDIALDELRVLSRTRGGLANAMIDLRHPVRVQLSPAAVTLVQPRFHPKGPERPPRQRELF